MAQISIDNLKKMASSIASTLQPNQQNDSQISIQKVPKLRPMSKQCIQSSEDVAQIVSVAPNLQPSALSQLSQAFDGEQNGGNETTNLLSSQFMQSNFTPDVYTIMGYDIPKNTLYLFILLIIVGIVIWYMSGDSKKKKNKREKNKDEEVEEQN